MNNLVFTPSMTNAPQSTAGLGDNLDFRGSRTERSQRTRIMVAITNPDVVSQDPVVGPDGMYLRDAMGNLQTAAGNTQYLPLVFGGAGKL